MENSDDMPEGNTSIPPALIRELIPHKRTTSEITEITPYRAWKTTKTPVDTLSDSESKENDGITPPYPSEEEHPPSEICPMSKADIYEAILALKRQEREVTLALETLENELKEKEANLTTLARQLSARKKKNKNGRKKSTKMKLVKLVD